MDGTYGNVYRQNLNERNVDAIGNPIYKANVNRSKTRKWVEAKVQNYDGDDWGADEYDDDEPKEPASAPASARPQGSFRIASASATTELDHSLSRTHTYPAGDPRPSFAGAGAPSSFPMRSSSNQYLPRPQAHSPRRSQTTSPISGDTPIRQSVRSVASLASSINHPQRADTVSSAYSSDGSAKSVSDSLMSSHGHMSPPPQTGGSGVPPARGDPRFPPRKSSRLQQDTESLRASLSGQRPGEAAAVQGGATNNIDNSSSSSNKPIPFIPPVEIYKQLADERESARQATESAGRPSQDSINIGRERVESVPSLDAGNAPATQKRQDDGEAARIRDTLGPTGLAPAAQRKSEYEIEGLLDIYRQRQPEDEPPQQQQPPLASRRMSFVFPSQRPASTTPPPGVALAKPGQQPDDLHWSSPKLPDLSRMSFFGDELFSGSGGFSTHAQPTTSRLAPISDGSKWAGETGAVLQEDLASQPHGSISSDPNLEDQSKRNSAIQTLSPTQESDTKKGDLRIDDMAQMAGFHPGSVFSLVQAINSRSSSSIKMSPSPSAATSNAPVDSESRAFRPFLPGEWVLETPTTGTPTPGVLSEISTPARQAPFPESNASNNTASRRGLGNCQRSAASHTPTGNTNDLEKGDLKRASQSSDSLPLAPKVSSPPDAAAESGKAALSSSSRAIAHLPVTAPNHDKPADEASSIKDTLPPDAPAPLNPKKVASTETTNRTCSATPVPSDFVPPQSLPTTPTTETATTGSPVKENDKLSEQILDSLSPAQPSGGFGFSESSAAGPAEHQRTSNITRLGEQVARETNYLGDVYDDYWEAGGPAGGPSEPGKLAGDAKEDAKGVDAGPATPPTAPLPLSPATQQPQKSSAATQPAHGLTRKFSWEMLSEEFEVPSPMSPSPLAPPVVAQLPAELHNHMMMQSSESMGISVGTEGDHLRSSPLASRSGSAKAPIDPSSPLSTRAEAKVESTSVAPCPPASEVETVAGRSSPRVASPSTPPPQAAANESSVSPSEAQHADEVPLCDHPRPSSKNTSTLSLNVLAFKQIMELRTDSEQTQAFRDTRTQFSQVDTGLNNWLLHMRNMRPELAHVENGSLAQALAVPDPLIQSAPADRVSSFDGHETTLTKIPSHHSPLGNVPMPANYHGPSGLSQAAQAGKEIGTKSKELLKMTGKMGKGLLSRGKNKLRQYG